MFVRLATIREFDFHHHHFCSKLINVAVPKTIDERAINLNFSKQDIFRQSENLELGECSKDRQTCPMTARHSLRMPAINSARGIGCKVVNIHPENISKAVPHLIMGLLWQIIRVRPSDRRTASVIETFPLE